MSKTIRKVHSPAFKAKVALESLKGEKTIAQLSSQFGVHVTQINSWKKQLKEGLATIFTDKRKKKDKEQQELIEQLYKQVGKKDIEIEWLKKKIELFD